MAADHPPLEAHRSIYSLSSEGRQGPFLARKTLRCVASLEIIAFDRTLDTNDVQIT